MRYHQFLQQYFTENQNWLVQNYPGINSHLFYEFAQRFFSLNELNSLVTSSYREKWQLLEGELEKGIPFAYLLQESYFYRSLFYVDRDVLIPRNETEIMVERCLLELKNKDRCNVCEVGVGSGAILLSIALEAPQHDYLGTDLCPKALSVAQYNYYLKKYPLKETAITFLQRDRLDQVLKESIDFLISNPPYIKNRADKLGVHAMVSAHEPELALFLEDNEYQAWFEVFFKQSLIALKKGGVFWMEGHENHLASLLKLALELGYSEGEMINDYSNRNRFLRLVK